MLIEDIWLVTDREDYFRQIGWEKFLDTQTALSMLEFQNSLMADLETSGLKSFLAEKIHSIQIGLPGKQLVFDLGGEIPITILKRPLEEKILYFQRSIFDLPYLYNHGIFPTHIIDTLVAEQVITLGIDNYDRDLATLADRYLGVKLDKELQKDIASGLTSVERILYAGRDVIYLEAIYEEQMKRANQYGVHARVKMECQFVPVLAYLEFSGAYIDMEYLYDYVREAEYEEWGLLKQLKAKYGDINWNSPQQVAPLLEQHGIKELSDKGTTTTAEEALERHPDKPIAVDLLSYRKFSKKVSTYGRRFFGYVQADGRIHTRFKQLVTTGRMACGESSGGKKIMPWTASYITDRPFPNFQNIPAKEMRGIIIPERGNVLIAADYSAQESVILADQSGVPAFLKFFKEEKGDIYLFIAKIRHPEWEGMSYAELKKQFPEERQIFKSVALLLPYGGDEHTIAADLGIPVEEAKVYYDAYFDRFPGLTDFFKKSYYYAKSVGYVPNDPLFGGKTFYYHGRKYKEKANDRAYWDRYWEEKRLGTEWARKQREEFAWYFAMDSDLRKQSVNYKIQGCGAVMMKLACIYFYRYISANKLHGKIKIVNAVHDEILIEVPDKMKDKMAKILQTCMEKAGNECLKNITIDAVPEIMMRWKKG